MTGLTPFVELEFAHALGPELGSFKVTRETGEDDVLQFRVVGAPPPKPILVRRARRAYDNESPRSMSVLLATLLLPSERFASKQAADAFFSTIRRDEEQQAALIEQAVEAINVAIRAHRAAARDPYAPEISRGEARAIRIGYGTPEQLTDGRWSEGFEPPPPRAEKLSREMRLRPAEVVSLALRRKLTVLQAEDLALRTMSDLAAGRPRSAAVQLRACIDLLVSELTDAGPSFVPPRDALSERAAAVERLAQLALDDMLDDAAVGELRRHLEHVEDALEDWRAWFSEEPDNRAVQQGPYPAAPA